MPAIPVREIDTTDADGVAVDGMATLESDHVAEHPGIVVAELLFVVITEPMVSRRPGDRPHRDERFGRPEV